MTDDVSYAVKVATKLRENDIPTQLYLEGGKFKKKLSYGDKLSIPFCIILGTDEIESNKVTLKDMTSGEQITDSIECVIDAIKSKTTTQNNIFVNMD